MSAYYDLYQSPPDENGEASLLHARILPKGPSLLTNSVNWFTKLQVSVQPSLTALYRL